MKKLIFLFPFLFIISTIGAQNFGVSQIPEELKQDAYAVVRFDEYIVEFQSTRLKIKQNFAVTVLEKAGLNYAFQVMQYDNSSRINKMEATIYDASGKKIKELKNKDIVDASSYDGFSMYTDNRIKYFRFTPTSYPFTIHYKLEQEYSSTLFLPKWMPVSGYNLGVESSSFHFINQAASPIRKKEVYFDGWEIEKSENGNSFLYKTQNIKPIIDEPLSPELSEIVPSVIFAPTEFQLEGVKGRFENWDDFGKWYYQNLLKGNQDLSQEEKANAKRLVDGISDPAEKVRILYEYLQSKTRYINVAIGIGGWKPYPASYVSSKSYGDCKALSNYMMSLLEAVGIESFYTIVNADSRRKNDIDKDFAYMQGNHVILNVPNGDETIWLECTSQQTAFNYLGKFTDDRYALSITPQGGKIIRTQSFPAEVNKEIIKGQGEILHDGKLTANFTITNSGLQYDRASSIYFEGSKEQKKILTEEFYNLPNLNIKEYSLENDLKQAVFTKNVAVESPHYGKIYGNNMALNVVPVGLSKTTLKKDDKRRFPFEVRFGYTDQMDFEFKIPNGYKLNGEFEPVDFQNEFGYYQLTIEKIAENILKIKRKIQLKDGTYPKEKFNDFVEFQRKISSFDNSKILLEKI